MSPAPERELPLANPVGKLDAGQCDGRTPEGFRDILRPGPQSIRERPMYERRADQIARYGTSP
jgi:hypothetical protein